MASGDDGEAQAAAAVGVGNQQDAMTGPMPSEDAQASTQEAAIGTDDRETLRSSFTVQADDSHRQKDNVLAVNVNETHPNNAKPSSAVDGEPSLACLSVISEGPGGFGPLVFDEPISMEDSAAKWQAQPVAEASIAPSTFATSLQPPVHRASHASSVSSEESASTTPTIIYGVVLVSFHHALGPIVEFSHPPTLKEDVNVNKNIPFLALPDGAHLVSDQQLTC